MITLYQFAPAFGLPNPSPFCFKVENYLRMTSEPYEVKVGNPQRAPKGKLPFIKDGGVVVCDSEHIVAHLKKTRGDKLDGELSAEQRAIGHLLRRTLEEALYFCALYARWVDDVGYEAIKGPAFSHMPAIARAIVPGVARRLIGRQVRAQGTGRHAPEDIYAMVGEDVAALSSVLGDKPYFLGQSPTSVDASAYAFLGLMLWSHMPSVISGSVEKHPNLLSYCERMRAKYYP